jgi:hypothetical protein
MMVQRGIAMLVFACCSLPMANATERLVEHVSLRNGFDMVCDHRVADGDKTRLYMTSAADSSFVEVATAEIVSVESVSLPAVPASAVPAATSAQNTAMSQKLTPADLHELLTAAGSARNLDVDLLACVVHAESGGRTRAVSRTGAQGLMQLMPHTAAELGVTDSFQPDQNINGGTAYLNALLVRYHDDLALALAAYNAGPKAVDRYHGVPPYRETRAYVARIIHEFNQRKLAEESRARHADRATSLMPASLSTPGLQSE